MYKRQFKKFWENKRRLRELRELRVAGWEDDELF
jgi:hypothetical protein